MATRTTVKDGAWSDPKVWDTDPVKPGAGDIAVIAHNVYIDENITTGSIVVNNGKLLYVESSVAGSYTVALSGTSGALTIWGTFRIGDSEVSPIPDNRTFTITFSAAAENYVVGSLLIYGSPTYHRASASTQRTRLTADVTAGVGQTFTVAGDVDYSVGDILWVTTGGDPDHAPTENEIITISSKLAANQYTATFVNNHFGSVTAGDIVIHATRNVIINGTAAQGVVFSTYTGAAAAQFSIFDINWCRFTYGSKGAGTGQREALFSFLGIGGTDLRKFFGSIKLCNNVGELPAVAAGYAIHRYNFIHNLPDPDNFTENHFYGYSRVLVDFGSGGVFNLGPLSAINTSDRGIYNSGSGTEFNIEDYLYVSNSPYSGGNRVAVDGYPVSGKLRVHRAYQWFNCTSNFMSYTGSTAVAQLDNCEFYNQYANGPLMPSNDWDIFITNSVFRRSRLAALYFYASTRTLRVYMDNCSFDECNTFNDNGYGAILYAAAGSPIPNIRLSRCSFGTISRNYRKNIAISDFRPSPNRMILNSCIFVQPLNFTPDATYRWYIPGEYGVGSPNRWLFWAVMPIATAQDWTYTGRTGQSTESTVEFCDCQIKDAGGTDYWSSMYPLTDRVGIIAGGSEIHKVYQVNEPAGYIDGTYARKFLPFCPTGRLHLNKAYPLYIPVEKNQTVTVKLSFKKNISQSEYRRPILHLFGCGVDSESKMSDVINTWEEITVSGTATCKGVIDLWISCWGVNDYYLTGAPPTRQTANYYAWAYPIDPGGTGYGVGTPSNLILYLDGLDVSYT